MKLLSRSYLWVLYWKQYIYIFLYQLCSVIAIHKIVRSWSHLITKMSKKWDNHTVWTACYIYHHNKPNRMFMIDKNNNWEFNESTALLSLKSNSIKAASGYILLSLFQDKEFNSQHVLLWLEMWTQGPWGKDLLACCQNPC